MARSKGKVYFKIDVIKYTFRLTVLYCCNKALFNHKECLIVILKPTSRLIVCDQLKALHQYDLSPKLVKADSLTALSDQSPQPTQVIPVDCLYRCFDDANYLKNVHGNDCFCKVCKRKKNKNKKKRKKILCCYIVYGLIRYAAETRYVVCPTPGGQLHCKI